MGNRTAELIRIIAALAVVQGCSDNSQPEPPAPRNFRQDMRQFVEGISGYAKGVSPGFIVIPQNGQELLTTDGEEIGTPAVEYLIAIDGVGREDLFYGFDADDVPTPTIERNYMAALLNIAEANGVHALVTDYCRTRSFVDDSYASNAAASYISFAADHRELDDIPAYPATPYGANTSDVTSLAGAKNFLYLVNMDLFASKQAVVAAIKGTNYDVVIMDLFFNETEPFTAIDVASLKVKPGGGSRLIVAYVSIGEAEDYRYYWQMAWATNPPAWLAAENPDWPGNFKVRYWDKSWQDIIFGNDASYLKRVLDSGFDGAYLDIVDAFEFFEAQ